MSLSIFYINLTKNQQRKKNYVEKKLLKRKKKLFKGKPAYLYLNNTNRKKYASQKLN